MPSKTKGAIPCCRDGYATIPPDDRGSYELPVQQIIRLIGTIIISFNPFPAELISLWTEAAFMTC